MKLSLIVPCFNEEASLPMLLARAESVIQDAFAGNAELIAVDDGSTDHTWPVLLELSQRYSFLIPHQHTQNRGLSDAWQTGAMTAHGEVVCLLDADLQYRPEEIPKLYQVWLESGADIVQGARERDKRPIDSRLLLSRGLNGLLNLTFGMSLEDNKSGFLLCRREVMLSLLKERHAFRHFQAMVMVAAHALGFSYRSLATPFDARVAGQSFLGQFPFRVSAEVIADLVRALIRYRLKR